jgi:hypothetical protein
MLGEMVYSDSLGQACTLSIFGNWEKTSDAKQQRYVVVE